MKFVIDVGGERHEVEGFDGVKTALAWWRERIRNGNCQSFTATVHAGGEDCDHELPEPLSVVGGAQRKGTG